MTPISKILMKLVLASLDVGGKVGRELSRATIFSVSLQVNQARHLYQK